MSPTIKVKFPDSSVQVSSQSTQDNDQSSCGATESGPAPTNQNTRDFLSEVLQITVRNAGESQTLSAHKSILERESPYFAALAGFQEGREKHVTLDDIDCDAFYQIVHWMYRNYFELSVSQGPIGLLISIWTAADRLLMERCKNDVMNLLVDRHAVLDSDLFSGIAFLQSKGYTESSPVSQFLLDYIAYCYISARPYRTARDHNADNAVQLHPYLQDQLAALSGPMALAVASKVIALAQRHCSSACGVTRQYGRPFSRSACMYHEHVATKVCARPH